MHRRLSKRDGLPERREVRIALEKVCALARETAGVGPDLLRCHHQCQEIIRRRVHGTLIALFRDLVGARLHVVEAPVPPLAWSLARLSHLCDVHPRLRSGPASAPAQCQVCLAQHLRASLHAESRGHAFVCPFGRVHAYWMPVRVRGTTIALVGFEAVAAESHSLAAPGAAYARGDGPPVRLGRVPVLAANRYARGLRLLRLMAHDLEATCQATIEAEDLSQLKDDWHTQTAAAVAQTPSVRITVTPLTQASPAVARMIEEIQQGFCRPLTLKELAGRFGMNVSYLSDLFTRSVGTGFKEYVTGLRMQKAVELLSQPNSDPTEVAYAVGYTDPHRFCRAFRERTGLPPRVFQRRRCPGEAGSEPGPANPKK